MNLRYALVVVAALLCACGSSDPEEARPTSDAGSGADAAPVCSDAGVDLTAVDAWCAEVCSSAEPCGEFDSCYQTCVPGAEATVARCYEGQVWSFTPSNPQCSPFDVVIPCADFACR